MFCPRCKDEYVADVTVCKECGIPLVAELRAESDLSEGKLVTVLEAADEVQLGVARSILDNAHIRYVMRSEGLQFIVGAVAGTIELQVSEENVSKAKELLESINEENDTDG